MILGLMFTSCGGNDNPPTPAKEYFSLWNRGKDATGSLDVLINYVNDVTNPSSINYIPVEDRIATFDMDGTFIGELYPTYFEYCLLEYRALEDPTYRSICPEEVRTAAQDIRDFVRTKKPLPDHFDMIHANAAAKAYAGMTLREFDQYVKDFSRYTPHGFSGMTFAGSFYKPMLEIFDYLEDNQFTYYVVSGSDRYICRALTESLGIPSNRVIGMDVELIASGQGDNDGVDYTMKPEEYLVRSENLLIKNLKTNKVKQISEEIGKVPVLSFGNSSGDEAMHNYCKGNKKYKTEVFMVLADNEDDDYVNMEETAKREQKWKDNKYNIFSMEHDFLTIYGEGVKKVSSSWDSDVVAHSYAEFHEEASEAPSMTYKNATLEYFVTDTNIDTEGTKTYICGHYVLNATYDEDKSSWTVDTTDPTLSLLSSFLNAKAKDIDQTNIVFDPEYYQNTDINYYTTEFGYALCYIGKGDSSIINSETTINMHQELFETRLFNSYGYCTYYQRENTIELPNASNSEYEILLVSYAE